MHGYCVGIIVSHKNEIAIYNDSKIFGGHEIMTIKIANTLVAQGWRVLFFYYHAEIPRSLDVDVEAVQLTIYTKTPLPLLRNLSITEILKVKSVFEKKAIRNIIIAQGDIEMCLKGLITAKLAGLKVISYLPMAYSFYEMNARVSLLRDGLNRLIYKIPDKFITISQFQKKMLTRFTRKKIYVVHNPVEMMNEIEKNHSNTRINEKSGPIRLGVIGRVYFRQKGQDRAIKLVRDCLDAGLDYELLIIGDGPDMNSLKVQCEHAGLKQKVRLMGWKESSEVLKILEKEIDVLLIPSCFEGAPLVFLEAVSAGIPLVIWQAGWLTEYEIQEELIINDMTVEEFKSATSAAMGEAGINMNKRMKKKLMEFHDPVIFHNTVNRTITALLE